jgi:molybdopterin converting factor small subunit
VVKMIDWKTKREIEASVLGEGRKQIVVVNIAEADDEIKKLEAKVAAMERNWKSALEHNNYIIPKLDARIIELQEKLERAIAERDAFYNEGIKKGRRITELEARLADEHNENTRLNDEDAALKVRLAAAEKEITRLMEAEAKLETERAELEDDIENHGFMRDQRDTALKMVASYKDIFNRAMDAIPRELWDGSTALVATIEKVVAEMRRLGYQVHLSTCGYNNRRMSCPECDSGKWLPFFTPSDGEGCTTERRKTCPSYDHEHKCYESQDTCLVLHPAPETPEGKVIWLEYGTCCKQCARYLTTPRGKEPCVSCMAARSNYKPPAAATETGEGSVRHKPDTDGDRTRVRASPSGTPTCAPAPADTAGDPKE